jgi:hypothetical protein
MRLGTTLISSSHTGRRVSAGFGCCAATAPWLQTLEQIERPGLQVWPEHQRLCEDCGIHNHSLFYRPDGFAVRPPLAARGPLRAVPGRAADRELRDVPPRPCSTYEKPCSAMGPGGGRSATRRSRAPCRCGTAHFAGRPLWAVAGERCCPHERRWQECFDRMEADPRGINQRWQAAMSRSAPARGCAPAARVSANWRLQVHPGGQPARHHD